MRISDWSSDVCSSDLGTKSRPGRSVRGRKKLLPNGEIKYSDVFLDRRLGVMASVAKIDTYTERENLNASRSYDPTAVSPDLLAITKQTLAEGYRLPSRFAATLNVENGTASCRERGCQYG